MIRFVQAALRSLVLKRQPIRRSRLANVPLALALILITNICLGTAQSTGPELLTSSPAKADDVEPFGSAFVLIAISITMFAGYFAFDMLLNKTPFRKKYAMKYHHKTKATPPSAVAQETRSSSSKKSRTPLAAAKSVQQYDSGKKSEVVNH